jgi:hypothetical protein
MRFLTASVLGLLALSNTAFAKIRAGFLVHEGSWHMDFWIAEECCGKDGARVVSGEDVASRDGKWTFGGVDGYSAVVWQNSDNWEGGFTVEYRPGHGNPGRFQMYAENNEWHPGVGIWGGAEAF